MKLPTMRRTRDGAEVPYGEVTDAMLRAGEVYASCQCPCGCIRAARSFAPDSIPRPDLCFLCMPPDDEHERPLTEAERRLIAEEE